MCGVAYSCSYVLLIIDMSRATTPVSQLPSFRAFFFLNFWVKVDFVFKASLFFFEFHLDFILFHSFELNQSYELDENRQSLLWRYIPILMAGFWGALSISPTMGNGSEASTCFSGWHYELVWQSAPCPVACSWTLHGSWLGEIVCFHGCTCQVVHVDHGLRFVDGHSPSPTILDCSLHWLSTTCGVSLSKAVASTVVRRWRNWLWWSVQGCGPPGWFELQHGWKSLWAFVVCRGEDKVERDHSRNCRSWLFWTTLLYHTASWFSETSDVFWQRQAWVAGSYDGCPMERSPARKPVTDLIETYALSQISSFPSKFITVATVLLPTHF